MPFHSEVNKFSSVNQALVLLIWLEQFAYVPSINSLSLKKACIREIGQKSGKLKLIPNRSELRQPIVLFFDIGRYQSEQFLWKVKSLVATVTWQPGVFVEKRLTARSLGVTSSIEDFLCSRIGEFSNPGAKNTTKVA